MVLWPMGLVGAPQGALLPIPKSSQGKKMEEREEEEEEECSVSHSSQALLASPAYNQRQPVAEEEQSIQ